MFVTILPSLFPLALKLFSVVLTLALIPSHDYVDLGYRPSGLPGVKKTMKYLKHAQTILSISIKEHNLSISFYSTECKYTEVSESESIHCKCGTYYMW